MLWKGTNKSAMKTMLHKISRAQTQENICSKKKKGLRACSNMVNAKLLAVDGDGDI